MDIKQRRQAMGISQAEFARRCGYSRQYICGVENGKEKLSDVLVAVMEGVLSRRIAGGKRHNGTRRTRIVPFKDAEEQKEFHKMWCERQGY